jgi:transposase-like protein
MNAETGLPETLHEAVRYFSTGDNAFNFMVSLRWPKGVCCPRCGSERVLFIATRQVWECREKHPRRQFSVKVGTIFEDSPIKLDKWFAAMWLVANCKNGVSSYEIHRELGVTQKTGWFMLHRIRLAMQSGSIIKDKFGGTVEVDESYIGGQARFMHEKVKKQRGMVWGGPIPGKRQSAKTGVFGALKRGTDKECSKVAAEIMDPTETPTRLAQRVRKYVLKGTEVHSDAHQGYKKLVEDYEHKVVDHAECYVKDGVHTNGLENFWSLLKRSLKGTYVSVEPFHLFRYLSEQIFRFNERKDDNHGRFLNVMSHVFGKRLTYKKLIGDNDGLPQAC